MTRAHVARMADADVLRAILVTLIEIRDLLTPIDPPPCPHPADAVTFTGANGQPAYQCGDCGGDVTAFQLARLEKRD